MISVATVFSGIGAIESALEYLGLDYQIVFACDNGERTLREDYASLERQVLGKENKEIQEFIKQKYIQTGKPNYVKETYMANYHIDDDNWFDDIKFLSGEDYLNLVDLFVGGSPCQSFSVNGKRAGLQDVRGTLFYDYARIVDECRPKVFIYENVRGMLNHDNGNTWAIVKSVFESLDYSLFIKHENGIEQPLLNSKDYGIPQNRDRIFIVGFRKDLNINRFAFPQKIELTSTTEDYLESDVDAKYYLGKKGFEFVTTHPNRARVGASVMGCQKANQQFNWNGDFIFEPIESVAYREDVLSRAYVGEWKGKKGVCRKYTPRECLRLMGFKDSFKIIHKDEIMYRQSGNSIVVNVLMQLVQSINDTGVWDND